jgi:hypothetical protein
VPTYHYGALDHAYFLRAAGFEPAYRLRCSCGWSSAWRPSPRDA